MAIVTPFTVLTREPHTPWVVQRLTRPFEGHPAVTKRRHKRSDSAQKHPEQDEQNPDQRKRTNRSGEAKIDQDNRRSSQQTERRRESGEREAVEGEGETASESAKL
jgi:hypothetical protein